MRYAIPKFAILKAGSASRPIRESLGDYDRLFLDLLAQPGESWDVLDVEHGQWPVDERAYDGFVITGSRASVYEDRPWIHDLLALLRRLHERQQRVLGICFGHQCLAQALGGEVLRSGERWHLGVHELQLTPAGRALPALRDAPQPLRILKLHGDVVTRLPPGAEALLSGPAGPHESFRIGAHVLTLQGHPEFHPAVIEDALARLRQAGEIGPEQAQRILASLAGAGGPAAPHREFLRGWLRGFLAQGQPILARPAAAARA